MSTPKTGLKIPASNGTPERLSSTDKTLYTRLWVQAKTNNSGVVGVGDSNVVADAGASQRGRVFAAGAGDWLYNVRPYDIYVDSATTGDGVIWFAETPNA